MGRRLSANLRGVQLSDLQRRGGILHAVQEMTTKPFRKWTPKRMRALLDIAHHAFHLVDDSEADETIDHTEICKALSRLDPRDMDPHETIEGLRRAIPQERRR